MALLLTTMFLGTSVMAYLYHVHPHENETVISQFARIMFTGRLGWLAGARPGDPFQSLWLAGAGQ